MSHLRDLAQVAGLAWLCIQVCILLLVLTVHIGVTKDPRTRKRA